MAQQCNPAVDGEAEACTLGVGVDVDVLPDELLMTIFRKVTDGVSLLDSVSLVCKRWNRVVRDPASWAGVRIELPDGPVSYPSPDCTLALHSYPWHDCTRLLQHAPAAEVLHLDLIDPGNRFENPEENPHFYFKLLSALRRSRLVVQRELSGRFHRRDFWKYVAPLLYRQRHLRVLRLELDVSGFYHDLDDSEYSGELAGKLPELRVLRLDDLAFGRGFPEGFVGDLVRGARALRRLFVTVPLPCDADRDACAELSGLEQLELLSWSYYPRVEDAPKAMAELLPEARILLSKPSPSLREVGYHYAVKDLFEISVKCLGTTRKTGNVDDATAPLRVFIETP